jgi:hypothetical protein
MKRAIALIASVLLTAACGDGEPITAEEARKAMPSAEQAQIATPSGSSSLAVSGGGSALVAKPRSGDVAVGGAPFAADTIVLAGAVNGGVAWTLGFVKFIASLPPTKCEGDTCTWGPGSGALDLNEFKLTVTKVDDHFTWAFAGRPKSNSSGDFTTFVSGNAWPSGTEYVGHGDLTIDLAATEGLEHLGSDPDPQGKIVVTNYDNRSARHLEVQFLGMSDGAASVKGTNAAYQFDATSAGGDLQVATRNLDTGVTLELHSRWDATGAGRGDAAVSDTVVYTESQCWSSAATGLAETYDVKSTGEETGLVSTCVYPDAVLPTITAP